MAEINYFATNDQLFWLQHLNLVMLKKLNTDFMEHSAINPIEPSATFFIFFYFFFLGGGGGHRQFRHHRTLRLIWGLAV